MIAVLLFGILSVANTMPTIHQFNTWKQTYGKVYEPKEELKRMKIFMDNLKYIEDFNARENRTMTLGLNAFSDLTDEEVIEQKTGCTNSTEQMLAWVEASSPYTPPKNLHTPSHFDWRDKGVVTYVKNQGQCGSCYAFSAVGAIESQAAIYTGKLVALSEQQAVDCAYLDTHGNYGGGCGGGSQGHVIGYITDCGGIDTEESYPYDAMQKKCRFKKDKIGAKVKGYNRVNNKEIFLREAVALSGPISVSIKTTTKWRHYKGGVFKDEECGNNCYKVNHGVLVVGYGTGDDGDYWIVKNSWGGHWGEDGYVRMARNTEYNCAIPCWALLPIIDPSA